VVLKIIRNEVWIFACIGEMFTGELKLDILFSELVRRFIELGKSSLI
jgi:hypothetical protein